MKSGNTSTPPNAPAPVHTPEAAPAPTAPDATTDAAASVAPVVVAPATTPETAAQRAARLETERRYVAITLTDALRDAINVGAKAANVDVGIYCRKIVADFLNVDLSVARTRSTSPKTDAERTAARDDHATQEAFVMGRHHYEMSHPDCLETADGRAAWNAAGAAARERYVTVELPKIIARRAAKLAAAAAPVAAPIA